MFARLDLWLLLLLNSLVPHHPELVRLFFALTDNSLYRGIPVFAAIVALWFAGESSERRARMTLGLLATAVATVASVWLQYHYNLHLRPALDPALHLRGAESLNLSVWDRRSSFPSDTSTLFFAMSLVAWRERRSYGWICLVWSLFTAGVVRVAVGMHYPSDVLASFLLAFCCVYAIAKPVTLQRIVQRLIDRAAGRIEWVHVLLFGYLADAYSLFCGLQEVLHGFRVVLRSLK